MKAKAKNNISSLSNALENTRTEARNHASGLEKTYTVLKEPMSRRSIMQNNPNLPQGLPMEQLIKLASSAQGQALLAHLQQNLQQGNTF